MARSGTTFRKGQVTNPKGRPKEAAEVKALAREYGREAVAKLVELMRTDPDGRTQLAAANALLDRGYGKPAQALTDGDGQPLQPGIIVLPAEVLE